MKATPINGYGQVPVRVILLFCLEFVLHPIVVTALVTATPPTP